METTEPYRIVSEPSWRVESRYKGEWVVLYYCQNEDSAHKCLARLRERAKQPADMSKILRAKAPWAKFREGK